MQLVTFLLDGQRHALPLATVDRVVHAVAVTPLPGAPAPVLGVIDIGGDIVPVFCLRRRFRLAARQPDLADQFVIVRTPRRRLALVVDAVQGVAEADPVASANGAPGLEQFEGMARQRDGLLLIHDVEGFLSAVEELALDEALASTA